MEKEDLLSAGGNPDWQVSDPLSSAMNAAPPDHLQYCFLNPGWDQWREQSTQFESAMSSMVSSPSNPAHPPTDSVAIRELIGRLGSICNSGEVSSNGYFTGDGGNCSANASCYATPLNSPPKLGLSTADGHQQAFGNLPIQGNLMPPSATTHLGPFAADPGFAERAARFSCFGTRNYACLPGQLGITESGRLSRVSSSKSLINGVSVSQMGSSDNSDVPIQDDIMSRIRLPTSSPLAKGQLETTLPVHMVGGGNSKKRKVVNRGKDKEIPSSPKAAQDLLKVEEGEFNYDSKKSKTVQAKTEQKNASDSGDNCQKQEKESNNNVPEAPKQDYIHVRARRGQATDSHSLAERVRREKISERMKFLQDLVPGCNKVTGKAVMLDEIINYVQSLQRQVEFLSMKLATVNPHQDLNMEALLQKDMLQSCGLLPHPVYSMTSSGSVYPLAQQLLQGSSSCQSIVDNGVENHCSVNPLDVSLKRCLSGQPPKLDEFEDAASMVGTFWENDLQSVVQMGLGQNQEGMFFPEIFHGPMPTGQMKVEL